MSRSLHRGAATRKLLLLLPAIFLLAGCTNGWEIKPPYCQPVNLPCKYMAVWSDLSGAGVFAEATSVVALNPIMHWWDSQVWAVRDCHTGLTYQIYGPVDYWPLKKVSK